MSKRNKRVRPSQKGTPKCKQRWQKHAANGKGEILTEEESVAISKAANDERIVLLKAKIEDSDDPESETVNALKREIKRRMAPRYNLHKHMQVLGYRKAAA